MTISRLIHLSPVPARHELALEAHLKQYGTLEKFRVLSWATPPFAIARLATFDDASRLLANGDVVLPEGARIRVGQANPLPTLTVCLVNVEQDCDEADLLQFLIEQGGRIVSVRRLYGRGVAFTSYETEGEVATAIQKLTGAKFKGRLLTARQYEKSPRGSN